MKRNDNHSLIELKSNPTINIFLILKVKFQKCSIHVVESRAIFYSSKDDIWDRAFITFM